MINLDQVRTLEWKVKQAVQLIVHLRRENDTLRGRLSETEVRLQELESLVEAFKSSQSELESGIRSALEELDYLDGSEPAPAPASGAAAEPEGTAEPAAFDLGAPAPAAEPSDLTFEEEFAALAAEEAAAQDPVPESVELEADRGSEDEGSEEKEPEQPGLGIF